jgi:hypothetical protein
MSTASLVIYGVAAVLGVQALLQLMVHYRRSKLRQLQGTELAKREAVQKAVAEQAERLPGKAPVRPPAVVKSSV